MKERRRKRRIRIDSDDNSPVEESIKISIKEKEEEPLAKTTRLFSAVVEQIKGNIIRNQEGSFVEENQ